MATLPHYIVQSLIDDFCTAEIWILFISSLKPGSFWPPFLFFLETQAVHHLSEEGEGLWGKRRPSHVLFSSCLVIKPFSCQSVLVCVSLLTVWSPLRKMKAFLFGGFCPIIRSLLSLSLVRLSLMHLLVFTRASPPHPPPLFLSTHNHFFWADTKSQQFNVSSHFWTYFWTSFSGIRDVLCIF